jgi:hypothetical protein
LATSHPTDTGAPPREVTGEPLQQRSSCEIKTSTRGADIAVKVYAGSPVGDVCDEAVREWFRTFYQVEAQLLGHRSAA